MADWTTLSTAGLAAGKIIRAIQGLAFYNNPIAIAEGAPGAPRVQGIALGGIFAGTGIFSNSIELPITGLDGVGWVRVGGFVRGRGSVDIAFSNTGGASYTAYSLITSQLEPTNDFVFYVNLNSGAYQLTRRGEDTEGAGVVEALSGTFTVPNNTNAIRMSVESGTADVAADFMILGGRP